MSRSGGKQEGFVGADLKDIQDRLDTTEDFPPFGSHIKAVEFTGSTERKVYHGLGRNPKGYIVTRVKYEEEASLYEASKTPRSNEYVLLTNGAGASATATEVDIWFF